MKKNTLPEDVILHILEYNPEHRTRLRPCLKQVHNYQLLQQLHLSTIQKKFGKILIDFDYQIETYSNWDLQSLVRKNIDNPDNWIRGFHKCNCCAKHQRKKNQNMFTTIIT